MLKKTILIFAYLLGIFSSTLQAGWLSSVGSALKSVGSTAVGVVTGAAKETENIIGTSLATGGMVSPTAVAQLDFCRQLASIPGGTMSLEYQRQCGNMSIVCQQVRMANPSATMDPYCATVSGMGQMMGPWGASTSAFIPGVNTATTPANTDPNKVGWSVPAPPPYGMTMGMGGGMGAYGVPVTGAAGFGSMLANRLLTNAFSRGIFGNSSNRGNINSFDEYDE